MRKLLLNTSAIATIAALTAGTAVADVSITGATEFRYLDRTSSQATLAGSSMVTDSEIKFSFTNKTDNGLTVNYTVEMLSDGGDTTIDESSFSVAGGFGKFVFGNNDDATDTYAMSAQDLIAEEESATVASSSISTNTDIADASDNAKVAYHMPAMMGVTAGVSYEDSGAGTSNANISAVGARYATEFNGMGLTLAGAYSNTEASTENTVDTNYGVKIVNGKVSASLATSSKNSLDEDVTATGVSASYALNSDVTLGIYSMGSSDSDDDKEEYKKAGIEVQYKIASGLTAVVNLDDYEYTAATTPDSTGTSVSDNGTTTKFTLKAAF